MAKTLLTTWQIKIINKKEFAKEALDKNIKAFVVYVTSFNLKQITIYLAQKAQITLLIVEKVVILAEYLNYANIFSKMSAAKLSKYFDINKHLINLKPGK